MINGKAVLLFVAVVVASAMAGPCNRKHCFNIPPAVTTVAPTVDPCGCTSACLRQYFCPSSTHCGGCSCGGCNSCGGWGGCENGGGCGGCGCGGCGCGTLMSVPVYTSGCRCDGCRYDGCGCGRSTCCSSPWSSCC